MIFNATKVYVELKNDDIFKNFSDSELMEYALKIVSTTAITGWLQNIDKSLEYIN